MWLAVLLTAGASQTHGEAHLRAVDPAAPAAELHTEELKSAVAAALSDLNLSFSDPHLDLPIRIVRPVADGNLSVSVDAKGNVQMNRRKPFSTSTLELPGGYQRGAAFGAGLFLIPRRIFFTSRYKSLDATPANIKENLENTMKLNPGFEVTWYDDAACESFLARSETGLLSLFQTVQKGMFKSDICRAAYLFTYGGFYTDLDVQLTTPLAELVDPDTSFWSAWNSPLASGPAILNAVIGVEPRSPVIGRQIALMAAQGVHASIQRLASPVDDLQWGPHMLYQGLQAYMQSCGQRAPGSSKDTPPDFLACGKKVRMLQEVNLVTPSFAMDRDVVLKTRQDRGSGFAGHMFALFYVGAHRPPQHVGFPRFAKCQEWGCGSLVQSALAQLTAGE